MSLDIVESLFRIICTLASGAFAFYAFHISGSNIQLAIFYMLAAIFMRLK